MAKWIIVRPLVDH